MVINNRLTNILSNRVRITKTNTIIHPTGTTLTSRYNTISITRRQHTRLTVLISTLHLLAISLIDGRRNRAPRFVRQEIRRFFTVHRRTASLTATSRQHSISNTKTTVRLRTRTHQVIFTHSNFRNINNITRRRQLTTTGVGIMTTTTLSSLYTSRLQRLARHFIANIRRIIKLTTTNKSFTSLLIRINGQDHRFIRLHHRIHRTTVSHNILVVRLLNSNIRATNRHLHTNRRQLTQHIINNQNQGTLRQNRRFLRRTNRTNINIQRQDVRQHYLVRMHNQLTIRQDDNLRLQVRMKIMSTAGIHRNHTQTSRGIPMLLQNFNTLRNLLAQVANNISINGIITHRDWEKLTHHRSQRPSVGRARNSSLVPYTL